MWDIFKRKARSGPPRPIPKPKDRPKAPQANPPSCPPVRIVNEDRKPKGASNTKIKNVSIDLALKDIPVPSRPIIGTPKKYTVQVRIQSLEDKIDLLTQSVEDKFELLTDQIASINKVENLFERNEFTGNEVPVALYNSVSNGDESVNMARLKLQSVEDKAEIASLDNEVIALTDKVSELKGMLAMLADKEEAEEHTFCPDDIFNNALLDLEDFRSKVDAINKEAIEVITEKAKAQSKEFCADNLGSTFAETVRKVFSHPIYNKHKGPKK